MSVRIPPRRNKKHVWPNISIVNPGAGLNNVISDEYIANEEASDLLNIRYVEAGNPTKRNGKMPVGTGLVNNPKGLASFYAVVGSTTTRYLITIDGTAMKYLNSSTWTTISGASFSSGKNTTFTQAKGDLYVCNGFDAMRKLDNTATLTAPTTTPSASFSIFYNSYHIASGVASQPSRLYVSNPSDMSDFTVAPGGTAPQPDNSTDVPGATVFAGTPSASEARIYDVSKNDGDKITGLCKFQEKLIIFKERSTWQLTFDSNGLATIIQVSASIGCVGHRSIDNVENDVYFLSRNGYYTLGNQANFTANVIRTNELSAKIHPIIETINATNLPNTASHFDTYTFYSSVSTGGTTTNNRTIVFDRRYGAFSIWSGINANAWTLFIDSSNIKHLYYAADDEAQVYEIVDGTYTDNGTAISAQHTSKAINFGDFSLMKQVLYVDIEFRVVSGSIQVDLITDGGTITKTSTISSTTDLSGTIGYDTWGTPLWGGTGTAIASGAAGTSTSNVPYRIVVNKPTRTLKIKVSNSNNNENFILLGYKVYFRPYAPEKFDSKYKIT